MPILNPDFGQYGGQYVPDEVKPLLDQVEVAYIELLSNPEFQMKFLALLKNYVGRPTPLTKCNQLTQGTKTKLYLKRGQTAAGDADQLSHVLGQILLAQHLGKTELITAVSSISYGLSVALASAHMGLKCQLYVGAEQGPADALEYMQTMGAMVTLVKQNNQHGDEAVYRAAWQAWIENHHKAHYLSHTTLLPHPYPTIVRDLSRMVGAETMRQLAEYEGCAPNLVVASLSGGGSAVGMLAEFAEATEVQLAGVLPERVDLLSDSKSLVAPDSTPQLYRGTKTIQLDEQASYLEPELAHLYEIGRLSLECASHQEAMNAYAELLKKEGVIAGLEPAYALAYALKRIHQEPDKEQVVAVYLSGGEDVRNAHLG